MHNNTPLNCEKMTEIRWFDSSDEVCEGVKPCRIVLNNISNKTVSLNYFIMWSIQLYLTVHVQIHPREGVLRLENTVVGDGYGLQHQSIGFKSCLNTQWARCNGFCDLWWSILTVQRWYVQFERVFTRVVTSTLRWTNWSEYGELRKVMGSGMLLRWCTKRIYKEKEGFKNCHAVILQLGLNRIASLHCKLLLVLINPLFSVVMAISISQSLIVYSLSLCSLCRSCQRFVFGDPYCQSGLSIF